jgi:hypothetical protein
MDENTTGEPETRTHFAPAERASEEELKRHFNVVSKSPMIDSLLQSVYGLLAVLNEERQILAVNDALLATLGVQDADRLLGLRSGEALQCVHAQEEPGGCGTSRFCSTCGAAIAMVTTLGTDRPAERECAITAQTHGAPIDLYFLVRCCPIVVEGQRFLLLLLRDLSAEQQRAALERVFYHDVSNLIENLVINSRLLNSRKPEEMPELAGRVEDLASRLASEVKIQKAIARGPDDFDLTLRPVFLDQAILNLRAFFHSHPAAQGKTLRLPPTLPELRLSTDGHLLERVLLNMVTNALEATGLGGEVRLWLDEEDDAVTFCVWNQGRIPEDVARRVFQRNFSTKTGNGRGLGTFAMKLLGETYLRGQVSFTTSEAEGTVFRLRLLKKPPPGNRPL